MRDGERTTEGAKVSVVPSAYRVLGRILSQSIQPPRKREKKEKRDFFLWFSLHESITLLRMQEKRRG